MNPNWKNFLLAEHAEFNNAAEITFPKPMHDNDLRIYPVADFGVLSFSGKDAAMLLQGQITCNINDISEGKSSLGAICNPKGRVISTFLLVKTAVGFLMVLPKELLETVKKRLSMFILRSVVTITDCSEEYCLIGLSRPEMTVSGLFDTIQNEVIKVNFGKRDLIITEISQAIAYWAARVSESYQPYGSAEWRLLDMLSGIPWLSQETSEEFIPQMLNLDRLGGISFNKGCYTGQEIVARTHYLGKAKRAMFLAECQSINSPSPKTTVFDDNISDSPDQLEPGVGKVLSAQVRAGKCYLLIVLQISETDTYQLKLADQTKLILLPFVFS